MEKGSGAMKPQLVIPMTGISSRFTNAGYTLPKFLLQVDGQTVIEHVLDMFPEWDDVIFCCNEIHLDDPDLALENLLKSKRPDSKIVRVTNNTQGPGWAVFQAREHIDKARPVVVNYCDFTGYWDADILADELNSGLVDGCIPAYSGFHPHMSHSTSYAYLKIEDNLVTDIQEKKPWTDNPKNEYASSGTYGFASGQVLLNALQVQIDQKITLNDEFYLSLTYKPILAAGGKVSFLQIQHFMQWGTPQDFEEYKDYSQALSHWTSPRPGHHDFSRKLSKVVLASGAGKRFSDQGYKIPKPALTLTGKTLLEHSLLSLPPGEAIIVTRSDLNDDGLIEKVANELNSKIVILPKLSRGQAESALMGILASDNDEGITVTACDAISVIDNQTLIEILAEVGPQGLIIWASDPHHAASRKPEQYGWVSYDLEGNCLNTWVKQVPEAERKAVMTGTFTFGSQKYAAKSIEDLINDGVTVNGEFYLDSLVQRQIDAGLPCRVLLTPSFVSVGTPDEYESVLYWQSCFDKWPLHKYKLANDPMVDQKDIARISKSFRVFPKSN